MSAHGQDAKRKHSLVMISWLKRPHANAVAIGRGRNNGLVDLYTFTCMDIRPSRRFRKMKIDKHDVFIGLLMLIEIGVVIAMISKWGELF